MELKQVVTVKTKLNKDDKNPKVTVLTLDFTGCKVENLIPAATDTLVINKQGQWRRAKAIPQKEEVNVLEMIARMGSRSQAPATVEGLAAVASTFSAEQRAEFLALLQKEEKEKAAAAKKSGRAAKQDGEKDRPSA